MNIPHDVLKAVVSLNTLATTEKYAFESCVRWAKHQLLELGNKDPSDEEVRDKLGDVLYEICFPTMTAKEFARLTAHSNILTTEEKHAVYIYLMISERLRSLKFVSGMCNCLIIKRLTLCDSAGELVCTEIRYAISFKTTVDLQLTGVGLYGGVQESNHDVTLRVYNGNYMLSKTKTMRSDGGKTPIKIRLEEPVNITAKGVHTVAAVTESRFVYEAGIPQRIFSS